MLSENQLKFVQVENNTAVIDSRIYCRDIIEVDHHDWVNNILKKYQPAVEARFGQVRFENAYVNIPNGGKKETKYVLLTEAQCNAFLSLSRNSERIVEKKLDLIADFESAKNQVRASLERALLSESNPEVEALKQENTRLSERVTELEAKIGATISDRLEFPYSSKQLHRDSRIASHSYVVGAIKRDFIEGQDYQVVENELFMTEQMYLGFMLSFRSEKGADISALPDTLLIITKFFFQFQQARSKKNARVAQSGKYKQMELLE